GRRIAAGGARAFERPHRRARQGPQAGAGPPAGSSLARRAHRGGRRRSRPCRHCRGGEWSDHGRSHRLHPGRRRSRPVRGRCSGQWRGPTVSGPAVSEATSVRPLDVFLVAGESSGDVLGAGLMEALRRLDAGPVWFRGVGGPRMAEAGLTSLFPVHDLMTIGIAAVVAKLPTMIRRLRDTIDAIVAAPPDVLIVIDVPDFSLRVARA